MIHIDSPSESNGTFRTVTDSDGVKVAYFSLSDQVNGQVHFDQVVVDEGHQKNGFGADIYRKVRDELHPCHVELVSDPDSFSANALALWLSLVRRGDAERLDDGTKFYIDERQDVYGARFRMTNPRPLAPASR